MGNENRELLNLTHSSKWRGIKIIILALITGACSFGFIAYYNYLIQVVMVDGGLKVIRWDYAGVFVSIVAVFIISRRVLAKEIIDFSIEIVWKFRQDIINLILKANYQQLQKHKTAVHTALVFDVHDLSSASMTIIEFIKSSIIIIASFIYMAFLSWKLSIIVFVVALGGVLIYQFGMKQINLRLRSARVLEDSFLKYFGDIMNGFKEIQIDPRKGNDINENKLADVSKNSQENNINAYTRFLNFQITGQILFYFLIAAILLVFSVIFEVDGVVSINYMFVLFFLLQSLESLILMFPSLAKAKISAERVNQLKHVLYEEGFKNEVSEKYFKIDEFENLSVNKFEYSFENEGGFGIGPITMEVNKGELIFIYGGNGSGKTTFIQSMLGLLMPDEGEIKFNGEVLSPENYKDYRTLFSVVFSDFYLFDEFYGIEDLDEDLLAEYLELFEIESKVEIVDGKFSTTELSTGQRKRLALVAALIEQKPVLVMDEWAADQDPYFRAKFYKEILPLFTKKGITVLAITHDDKYYGVADRIYKMDEGALIPMDKSEFK